MLVLSAKLHNQINSSNLHIYKIIATLHSSRRIALNVQQSINVVQSYMHNLTNQYECKDLVSCTSLFLCFVYAVWNNIQKGTHFGSIMLLQLDTEVVCTWHIFPRVGQVFLSNQTFYLR